MIIAQGERIALRRLGSTDLDALLEAHAEGEWRDYDAPFEPIETDPFVLTDQILRWCECEDDPPRRALIVGDGEIPLGLVNRYENPRFAAAWSVGIGIFRSRHWDRGLGTEALNLWIDLLFARTSQHRLGLSTWSLNPRMIHLARKLGFRDEGVERELVQWKGEWLDRHRFGLLREEWRGSPASGRGSSPDSS